MRETLKHIYYQLRTWRKPQVYVICGPTASGKSSLGIQIAQELQRQGKDVEIISADSRQIYREIPHFSGATTPDKQQNIVHHLVCTETLEYPRDASWFRAKALQTIQEIHKRGNTALVVGGTGFWIQSLLFKSPFPQVAPDPDLRERLNNFSDQELEQEIERLDPYYHARNPSPTTRRLIRAIEIATVLGYVPERDYRPTTVHRYVLLYLDCTPGHLATSIAKGVSQRLTSGMLDELQQVFDQYGESRTTEVGLGFKSYTQYQNADNQAGLHCLITTKEKQYAKRQITYFKKLTKQFPGKTMMLSPGQSTVSYLHSHGIL